MFDHPSPRHKTKGKRSALITQRLRLTKGLKAILASADFSQTSLQVLLREEAITSERLIAGVPRLIEGQLKRLSAEGLLSSEEANERRAICRSICFDAVVEDASELHELLSEKPFYRDSDRPTRSLLRARALRFAERHKLTVEQAVSLWEGEESAMQTLVQWLLGKCALWLPLLLTLLSGVFLCIWLVRRLDIWTIAPGLLLLCPIWEGFAELIEGGLRLLLPASPLPALQKEKAPPVCAMLVASVGQGAADAMRALEKLLAANRDTEGTFGIILTLPDAPTRHSSDDARLYAPFLQAFEELEMRTDRPLRLSIAERSYLPRARYWRGTPTPDELLKAAASMIAGDDSSFRLTLGKRNCAHTPDALYIAPADSTLAPDGLRALAASLFHPLCHADCVLPILRTVDRRHAVQTDSLVKRQVTLQKLGSALPYHGFGMIKRSAIAQTADAPSTELACALTGSVLFVQNLPVKSSTPHPTEARLSIDVLPTLRTRLSAIGRLPLYLMLICTPPTVALSGLLLASADLIIEALFSLRIGSHFVPYTLQRIARAGRLALDRLIFPIGHCLSALPYFARLSARADKRIRALSSVCVGIATAAYLPLPFSAIGLVWAASPLLTPASIIRPRKVLSTTDKEKLIGLCRKNWAFFEQFVTNEHPLPPEHCTELPRLRASAHTTPDAFAFYLIACLAACDLGFIDPFTLEKRLNKALDAWEKLPTHHGLPYARYSLETGDSCGQCGVDTAACGRFALSMAALSAGVSEYAAQNRSLKTTAERVLVLWKKMDLSVLYDPTRSAFFEALLPNGEGVGRLDLLMSGAQCVCIAALAAGQIDPAAWKKLRRPAAGKGFCLGLQSVCGALEEYLLPALFLPASDDCLIGRARSHACRQNYPKDDDTPCGASFAYGYLPGGSLSDKPLPSGQPALARMQGDLPWLYPPHATCLMLSCAPSTALKSLRRFEAFGALGRFGFYEAIDRSVESGRLVRMWSAAHLGQSMAAAVNCLRSGAFQRRTMQNPSLAALLPLLNEPLDRTEPALPPIESPSPYSKASASTRTHTDEGIPSIFLLGDSRWGVLWAEGRRMLPFYRGRAMAYPVSPHHPYEDGHFSGLLLFHDHRPIAASPTVFCREDASLTLAYRTDGCSVLATLASPIDDLLSLTLSCDGIEQQITALFCFSPITPDRRPIKLETLPVGNILLVSTPDTVIALAADGLEKGFIRAEEAPLPLGLDSLSALLSREGSFTEGRLLTPTCTVGGGLGGSSVCRILLAFGKNRAEVLEKIKFARPNRTNATVPSGVLLPNTDSTALSYAFSLELQLLFEHLRLCPILPEPAGVPPSPNLLRCIEDSLLMLEAKGFQKSDTPYYLPKSGELPTDELLRTCLRAVKRPTLTSPPMPARTRIVLTEQALVLKKGRDLPPVCRLYADGDCLFHADSYSPSFRFEGSAHSIPITLTLPDALPEAERSLFYGAHEVYYAENEVRYTGQGYSVAARLADDRQLLLLEVTAPLPASIRLDLPEADSRTEDCDFWHRGDDTVDFCCRSCCQGRSIFLLGSFCRSSDRDYYRIREELSASLAAGLAPYPAAHSTVLTWQGQLPYPTPLLVHPALASNCPEAFPLLLFFSPHAARDALQALFSTDNRLMQVIACLLWERSTEDREELRRKIDYPTSSGMVCESIYLAAARALEALLENHGSSSADCPLLPRLTAEFADLAHRMGDLAGEALYRSRPFAPEAQVEDAPARSLDGIALLLLRRDPKGIAAWKHLIDTLPLFPSPEEGSRLWSLFWYGILGYRETAIGFSLTPLLSGDFEGCAFTMRRRETVYRVRIAFSEQSGCLLDGKSAEMPFLFDKKEHFLEITVEKSPRMV